MKRDYALLDGYYKVMRKKVNMYSYYSGPVNPEPII